MKIRPLHDRVVVRRSEEETKTAGGIVLPGSAAEKPNTGVIVAAGTGRQRPGTSEGLNREDCQDDLPLGARTQYRPGLLTYAARRALAAEPGRHRQRRGREGSDQTPHHGVRRGFGRRPAGLGSA